MSTWRLVRCSLTHYWRTNLAVVLGVATAVAVLAGALLVGHSVRASLADLVTRRLGATDFVISSPTFFREQLAADLSAHVRFAPSFDAAVPIIAIDGAVTEQESSRRAGRVKVYGVDDRFWRFHGAEPVPLESRDVALSPALAREIGARQGAAVLVRVQRPSDIPLESLHSRKDDVGRTVRLTVRTIVPPASLGDFSLDARQGEVMAAFVPLARLREALEVGERVNTILVSRDRAAANRGQDLSAPLKDSLRAADIGITARASADGSAVIVGSSAGLVDDRQAELIRSASSDIPVRSPSGSRTPPRRSQVFTYLANTMRIGDREIPYSLVTGLDPLSPVSSGPTPPSGSPPSIVLNAWAARELAARPGDRLTMDYYIWEDAGRLATRNAEFTVSGVVPTEAGSRDLAPDFPGISDTDSLSNWDPPFPLDLRRVRRVDEDYWDRYRTTPKAFVALEVAQRLWGSRYGSLTSVRLGTLPNEPMATAVERITRSLDMMVDPETFGLALRDIRTEGLAASRGATDFGEYFVYFSFFIVVSALVLVVLFFKLGIEQRAKEVGLLRAVGLSPRSIRRLFTAEGLLLALLGSLIGMGAAVGYAWLLMRALTTWWVDSVGTTALTLHLSSLSLATGAAVGVVAAVICIWWTLRALGRVSERTLLAGEVATAMDDRLPSRSRQLSAVAMTGMGVALAVLATLGVMPEAGGFFGAGAVLLVAALTFASLALRRPARHPIAGHGWLSVSHLATRYASHRPGRSVLSMAVIASATFILVTVDAFRRDAHVDGSDRHSGTGGYELMVQTLLPIVYDPNSETGRDSLNLGSLDRSTTIEPFRVRPGDDASCLNLYQPTNPRIVAPRDSFLTEGRFTFRRVATGRDEERADPWLLLNRVEPDGAIPVIADANSMTYVLHKAVGDDLAISARGRPVTLRFVGALSDSIFQSEVLMSERNFVRLFPEQDGFQLLLVDTSANAGDVANAIEQGMSDAGGDAVQAGEYLASFHRVENTYLSTFQALGGLGLLLGTVGLATVLLRNVLERRRELALLAAVGYRRSHFLVMAVAENLLIVCGGLAAGVVCAAIAIAPAVADRGGRLPFSAGALLLLFSVLVVAMLSSVTAMAAVAKSPLLGSLRSD